MSNPPAGPHIPAHVAQHLPPHLSHVHRMHAAWAPHLAQIGAAMAAIGDTDPGGDPLGVADPSIPHPGADQCAVCSLPRGLRDREWNSSGTWWCGGCKDAYAAYRADHPIAAGPHGMASQMPTYMYAPAYWPHLGFNPADLDPYRPGATPPPSPPTPPQPQEPS